MLDYWDFLIAVRGSGQSLEVSASFKESASSKVDKAGPFPFKPPLAADDIDVRLREVGDALATIRSTRGTSEGASKGKPAKEDLKRLGRQLFESIFLDEIRKSRDKAMREAKRKDCGLRLRLELPSESPLHAIPWEFLYDHGKDDFPVLGKYSPMVRSLGGVDPPEIEPRERPLRMLSMAASPTDFHGPLDLAPEEARLEKIAAELGKDLIEYNQVLGYSTLGALDDRLDEVKPDILHFMGHGGPTEKGNCLVFCNEYDQAEFVSAHQLQRILPPSVKLVVLNCCESAASDPANGFGSIATHLARNGVPAVVAMQYPISNDAATLFSKVFYERLLREKKSSLEFALTRARRELDREFGYEWAVPVLNLQSDSAVHLVKET